MTYQQLDLIFPFFVFIYGAMMTFVLNNQKLMAIARDRFPIDLLKQMNAHRKLAIVCLIIGGPWSLQTLWMA